jgi:hypothetical protein
MSSPAVLIAAGMFVLSAGALSGAGSARADQPAQAAAHAGEAADPARQTAKTGGAKFSTALTGAAEVPPADADGTGSFTATLNPGHDQLCYELKVDKIEAATAAHIHEGAVGQNGGPVVTLQAPKNGASKACAAVANDLAMKLMQNPENYYVNVHNAPHPNGAVRGQLTK